MPVILYGRFRSSPQGLEAYHPEIIDAKDKHEIGRIIPVYPEIEGISQRKMRRLVADALKHCAGGLKDPLPAEIRERRHLPELGGAFREAHFPVESVPSGAGIRRSPARRRLAFDELFMLQLALALKKENTSREAGIPFTIPDLHRLYRDLPFELTGAQRRIIREVVTDMAKPFPMNRLLQGDVGCGKTLVALIGAWVAVRAGYQVAFMAPTQLLAEQHYLSARALTRRMELNTALLISGMGLHANTVREGIKQGDIDVLIGTHALIQERVEFRRLGLGIIDE
jgi:ATP-dependent DNA helicase RecG